MEGRRKGSCKFWRLDSQEQPIEFEQFAGEIGSSISGIRGKLRHMSVEDVP